MISIMKITRYITSDVKHSTVVMSLDGRGRMIQQEQTVNDVRE